MTVTYPVKQNAVENGILLVFSLANPRPLRYNGDKVTGNLNETRVGGSFRPKIRRFLHPARKGGIQQYVDNYFKRGGYALS